MDARARQALAAEVADRFDQYLYFRPSMIAAWDRGEAWDGLPEPAQGDEAWQRELWRRLSESLADHHNPAVRLQELVARIQQGDGELPGLARSARHRALAPHHLAPATCPGYQNPCLPARLAAIHRISWRHASRTRADASGKGSGPRLGRASPAVAPGKASRRQLSQLRRGTRHRRSGVRRHRAARVLSWIKAPSVFLDTD